MNENTKATLTNLDTWKRGLFMVFFGIISGVAKLIVALVAVFQFITLLFKGQVNGAMLPLGQNLSTYLYQITLFLTFKTDQMPYPFLEFPDGAAKSEPNEAYQEDIGAGKATTNHQQAVEPTDENIDLVSEDETEAQNNTKD